MLGGISNQTNMPTAMRRAATLLPKMIEILRKTNTPNETHLSQPTIFYQLNGALRSIFAVGGLAGKAGLREHLKHWLDNFGIIYNHLVMDNDFR